MPTNERKAAYGATTDALESVENAAYLSQSFFGKAVSKKWARAIKAVKNAQEANVLAVGMARIMDEEHTAP